MGHLVLAVAFLTVAATLRDSPSSPRPEATLDQTARLVSQEVPDPSAADPLYPLNQRLVRPA